MSRGLSSEIQYDKLILFGQNTKYVTLFYNPVSDYTRIGWREKRLHKKNLGWRGRKKRQRKRERKKKR